jgi:hypothetical protein
MQSKRSFIRRLSFGSGESSDQSLYQEPDTLGIINMIEHHPTVDLSSIRSSQHQDGSLHINNSLQQQYSSQSQSNVKTNVSSNEQPNDADKPHHECHAYTLIDAVHHRKFVEYEVLQRLHLDLDQAPVQERALARCLCLMAILNTVTQARISFENMTLSEQAFNVVIKSQFTYHINMLLINSLNVGWKTSSTHLLELAEGIFLLSWVFNVPDSQCTRSSLLDGIIEPELICTKYQNICINIQRFLRNDTHSNRIVVQPLQNVPLGWVYNTMDVMYAYYMLFDSSEDALCGKCKKKLVNQMA